MTTPHDNDIERRLAFELRREAERAMTLTDTPKELRKFQDRMKGRTRRNRMLVAAAASVVLVAGGIAAAVALTGSSDRAGERVTPAGPPSTAPSTGVVTLPAPTPLPASARTTLSGPGSLGLVAFGSVWATTLETPGEIYRIAPDGSRVLSRAPLDGINDANFLPFQAGRLVLVPNGAGTAYLGYDSSGRRVATVPAKKAAFGTGDASGGWIQTDTHAVARLDATGTHVVRTLSLPDVEVGAMATSGGALWVIDVSGSRIVKVDAQSGRVAGEVAMPGASQIQVVFTRGALFVASDDFTVRRVDPSTSKVTATLQTHVTQTWPILTVATNGDLWVQTSPGLMAKANTETLSVERYVEVFQHGSGSFGINVNDTTAFIADGSTATVYSFPLG